MQEAIIVTTLNYMGLTNIMAKFDEILIYSQNISWGEINDEVFVFDESNGSIYLFKGMEREIWNLIRQRYTISSMIDFLRKHFNVDEEKTLKVITKFQKGNLVKRLNYEK